MFLIVFSHKTLGEFILENQYNPNLSHWLPNPCLMTAPQARVLPVPLTTEHLSASGPFHMLFPLDLSSSQPTHLSS